MSRTDDLRELLGEIRKYDAVSHRLVAAVERLVSTDIESIGKSTTTAMAAAGLIENSYTAIETVLLRISQNFGNSLRTERWHSDLLQRMSTAVPDVRPAAISETTCASLDELMRFRHFKRYYFNLEFDWNRLDYLLGLLRRVTPIVVTELERFGQFVIELIQGIENDT
jgi:hypothetical protein